jgi:CubicO group peptidase (beta-lactamase class C family)
MPQALTAPAGKQDRQLPRRLRRLRLLLDELIVSGTASAAVALVGGPERIEISLAAGWVRGGPPAGRPATAGTWFDYGSLTKPFVATLALLLDRSGELPLATRTGEVLAGASPLLAELPLAELLRHGARMRAWTPLYARCRSLAEVEALLLSGELLGARRGIYSDLDYLLWGLAAERALGRPLAALIGERVLEPLGLAGAVAAVPGDLPQVAESRMDSGREVALAARQGIAASLLPPPPIGLPQDGNARLLAGLAGFAALAPPAPAGSGPRPVGPAASTRQTSPCATSSAHSRSSYGPRGASAASSAAGSLWGHGGLFGTAAALWRLGAEWLTPRILLQEEEAAAALAGSGPFALGWWRRRHRGAGGPALSAAAYGHTGFAGGSLWIDPEQSRVFVLLAHRLDPECNLNRWRRRFHATATRAAIASDGRNGAGTAGPDDLEGGS